MQCSAGKSLAEAVLTKIIHMTPEQRTIAENIIRNVLFEGEFSNLRRNSHLRI